LDALPMTTNGKLDRAALPRPEYLPGTARGVPQTVTEEIVVQLFAQALERPSVSPEDDFFELGGHSLTAIRLINRIRAVLGTEVTVEQLFEARTPRAVAGHARATVSRPPLTAREHPDDGDG